jgi:hypothetical protein
MLRARDSRRESLLAAWLLLTTGGCELVSGLSSLKVEAPASRPDAASSASSSNDRDAAVPDSGRDASPGGSASMISSVVVSADAADTSGPGPHSDAALDAAMDSAPSSTMTGADGSSPDAAGCTPPVNSSCDPVDGCGCGVGETCTYSSGSDPVAECFTQGAVVPPASACAESIDCGDGYYCHEGVCARACRTEADCPHSAALCLEDAEISGASYCTSGCDPLDASPADPGLACGDGAVCVLVQSSEGGGLFSECVIPTDTRGVGEACESAAQCETSLTCLDGACTPFCDVGGDECPWGTLCELQETLLGVDVGVCTAPACVVTGSNPCAVLPFSCGCGDGQQCQLVNSSGATGCKDIGTDVTCATDEDCALGNTCIPSKDIGSDFLCLPYCDDTSPCAEGACSPIPWDDGEFAGGYCGGVCDPLDIERDDATVTPCPTGQHCGALFGEAPGVAECAASTGTAAPGDSCAYSTDCEAGAGCACEDGQDCRVSYEYGVCLAYCEEDTDCSGPNAKCLDMGYSQKMCVNFPTAASNCPLLLQGVCEEPSFCAEVASDGTTACVTDEQTTCSYTTDCAEDLQCASGLCRPLCSVVDPCSESQQCSSEPLAEGGAAEVCLGRCDPVNPFFDDSLFTPCGLGAACLRGDQLGIEGSSCVPALSELPIGAGCLEDAECGPGLGCDPFAYYQGIETPACTLLCRDDYACEALGPSWKCDLTSSAAGWGYDDYDVVGVCYDRDAVPPEEL